MPIAPVNPYTARFALPDLIVRNNDNTLRCPVYRNGALVTPTGGLISVYDASGTAIVDGESATVTNSVIEYTIPTATLPTTLPLEMGWRVEWTIVLVGADPAAINPDDGIFARNDAALIRQQLRPVITDADLDLRLRGMDHTGRAPITTGSSQDAIDEAWIEINHRLINQGNRPNLITSPSALRMPHLFLALAIRLDGLGPAYAERANSYRRQYESAWLGMSFLYDSDDDGEPDSPTERQSGTTSVWLG